MSISIPKTYAAFGNAKDGDLFAVSLIGVLLLLAGILFCIDYLRKNGKQLLKKMIIHKKTKQIKDASEPSGILPDESKTYFDFSF